MKYKTPWIKEADIKRDWYVVDVADLVLGRAATQIAGLLIGKGKVQKVPNMDCGDHVVVLNSDRIKVTGNKAKQKSYFRHSGFPGGAKHTPFDKQMEKDSRFVIEHAVKNMLPNNKLRASMLTRLHVYQGAEHKHEAQKPKEVKLS